MQLPRGQVTVSTTSRAAVVTNVAQIARDLVEQFLEPRRGYLKGRAPRSRYQHQLRRDIACGKAKPIDMILALSTADLDDGVPLSLVTQPYYAAIAALGELAMARDPRPALVLSGAPLLPLVQRETRAQALLDAAENEVLAHPDSLEAHDRCLSAAARYDDDMDRLVQAIRARRARLALARPTDAQGDLAG